MESDTWLIGSDKFSSQLDNDNMEYAQLYLILMIADIIINNNNEICVPKNVL